MELQKFVAIVDILMLVAAVIVFWMLLWPRKSPIARLPVPDWNNEPLVLLDIRSMHPNTVIMSNVFGITQETSTRMSELCSTAFGDKESLVYSIDIPEFAKLTDVDLEPIDSGVTFIRGGDGLGWGVDIPEEEDMDDEDGCGNSV